MLSKINLKKNEKGFTLIELLIVVAIIGILASIAIPQFNSYKLKAYSAGVKADLHNVYLHCKAYYSTGGTTCSMPIIKGPAYGFINTDGTNEPTIETALERTFVAQGTHPLILDDKSVTLKFTINSSGKITVPDGY